MPVAAKEPAVTEERRNRGEGGEEAAVQEEPVVALNLEQVSKPAMRSDAS